MFVEPPRVYYQSCEQVAGPALYLILVQNEDDRSCGPDNFRALVRKVKLRQCGHWMMGRARVLGKSLGVSGSYGSDGLPLTVSSEVFNLAYPVPKELYDAWNNGGGHNSCGSEAEAMREWAKENLKELRRRKSRVRREKASESRGQEKQEVS